MDESELKREAVVDNSRLEELMEKEITIQMQAEFFEILKESRLFMPVSFNPSMFESLENAKVGDVLENDGTGGFDINYLTDKDGNKAVPLFTSEEMMEKSGLRSSTYVLYMSDLADMLSQSDRYSIIAINPLTEHDINIPLDGFLSIFKDPEEMEFMDSISNLLEVIRKHSVELDQNATLILRNDDNILIDNAVDGIFTTQVPFYVSSNPEYGKDLKYTNILLMPKSKRILPISPDHELDIVIAPGTEFRLEDRLDEFTSLWMCGNQPFFDDE